MEESSISDQTVDGTFDILEIGCNGTTEVIPPQNGKLLKNLSTVPYGLPLSIQKSNDTKLQEYLLNPGKLPIHDFYKTQRFWPREQNPDSLFVAETCPVQTSIKVERNHKTGKLLGFYEVSNLNTNATENNSLSLNRKPGALSDPIKGKSTRFPFLPGGMKQNDQKSEIMVDGELDFETGLLDTPPHFSGPVRFGQDDDKLSETLQVLSVTDIHSYSLEDIEYSDSEGSDDSDEQPTATEKSQGEDDDEPEVILDGQASLDSILNKKKTQVEEPTKEEKPAKEQWAFMIDITKPVDDFHKKIPDMAHTWDFEPDTFQKQAILKVEEHESVFVAAHTSAGKTAVAEYAIALANRHKTKTIYTSPIKALSNQKFRDFKKNLVPSHPDLDVGLLTGDVQIKPEASCLIMTTEILRSMLYNGSDVIRDVEWVIFDEVHYINDPERGVVWEEVLIMLPDHVGIILLSATVPNTLEFADWIGRTKRKRIHVISTAKRPVPLEHFLYTGNSNKTSNELFLLLDQNSTFLTRGYQKAVDAIKERSSKSKEMYGAKGGKSFGNVRSDRNVWLSLVTMLEKKEKLPVVAFTFSRKKCDENADSLSNLNLTTNLEKSRAQVLLQKYLAKLKGTDRTLPQVKKMEELLKKGIGVHHSGVLPILKEVIEILFQEGLVKLLFATETFAMGVNMPARTVVFDNIRKHDGTAFRTLLSGEYVQMAGRAGRRGKDLTGTVIILCKGDVPEMAELHTMMLGKPISLNSQFRLTYSMILNLLRVEQLRVEEMMKRSFAEFNVQRDADGMKKEADQLEQQLSAVKMMDCVLCSQDLVQYYQSLRELQELTQRIKNVLECQVDCSGELTQHIQNIIWTKENIPRTETEYISRHVAVLSSPACQKALLPGRIVTLKTINGYRLLSVLLHIESSSSGQNLTDRKITLLSLTDAQCKDFASSNILHNSDEQILPFVQSKLFHPEGPSGHEIIKVSIMDICDITVRKLKIEGDKIIGDHKKRALPRFSNDPPCRPALLAQQELLRLVESNPEGLETMNPIKDFNIRDIDTVEWISRKSYLDDVFDKFVCTGCPKLQEHFSRVRDEILLREQLKHLKFLLSDESLHLIQDYHQRIEVLRKLRYIDSSNRVQLKGRVACENNHELMITELVFQNLLTDLHHTEIAALLSCFVFQQKRCSEPTLTKTLQEGKDRILSIAGAIVAVQNDCGLATSEEDFKEQFYFGLLEVVYEWAKGVPFSDITNLTDVQEGIIVRCIQRLDETCRDVRNAARIIGDPSLYKKMEDASESIRRDIVFAASLYTQ